MARNCGGGGAIKRIDRNICGIELYYNGRTKKFFEFDPKGGTTEISRKELLLRWGRRFATGGESNYSDDIQ